MSMNAIPEPVQPASLELVLADYIKAEGVEVAETYKPILAYVSNLASNQCIAETFHMFEWEKTCQAYLEPIMDAEKAAVVTKKFMDESEKRAGQLAGFPGAEELMKLRACFVDHDIDGSDANTPTIDFCLQEPILAPLGREKIHAKLLEMEFTEELIEKPICNLSGGWKMKLALARAVLLNADLLLLDEPTNHLGVQKQAWLCDFLTGPACAHVTTLVVSHDQVPQQVRRERPMAKAYFSIHDTEMKFTFPVPGPLEGVKSKTKAIIQAKNISFTYPRREEADALGDLSCQLAGVARKRRVAYAAQHAFHHIEQHLEMSPAEYIQWRFSGGLDKEQQAMEAAQMTDEEKAKLKQNFVVYLKELAAELDEAATRRASQIIFEKMEPLKAGQKPPPTDIQNGIFPDCVRQIKQLDGTSMEDNKNLYLPKVVLESNGFFKLMKAIDDKIAAEAGNVKPLTTGCIQKHLDDFGLMEEFGTYGKMKNLSGGQKVNRRTTSTATRSRALSRIKDFEGGVLMISHNAEFFGDIAPEIWEIPGDQKVHISSGAEWMEAVRARELAEQKMKKKARRPRRRTKKLDAANAMMKKEKEAAKAEKEAQKKLNKKEKAPADKKKASKKK
ncbi:ATPase [Aureococcus anophagefferens]|uniref:ATPase n=1 Tax=Aureococcus anophagefferens TaxID=44056 RepID=A0ABR1G7Q6_AURAN